MQIPLVDKKLVAALRRILPGIADIDIEQTVSVDVRHRHAGLPTVRPAFESGLLRDVFEFEPAEVEIQFAGLAVGGKDKIGQTIVVDIAGGYAAAVVKIFEVQHVQLFRLFDVVAEMDAGSGSRQQLKKRCLRPQYTGEQNKQQ